MSTRPLLQTEEMSTFRTLAREIHRRSVWQVLGVYLFAAWIALQVVDVLTNNYGLPDWVPGFALVLLVIGLPVVLATAIVQEGAPGRETWTGTAGGGTDERSLMEGEPHPLAAAEPHPLAPEEPRPVAGSPGAEGSAGGDGPPASASSEPGLVHRLFNWRNAILGGVAAFALLGFAVALYFTMWATGVGPVGSLVAQGVIEERDRVVLADFGNATDDPSLGGVVTEALRVDLVQSPILTVADPSFVDRVLQRMGRDPSAELTPELAREVAIREGLKAVIQGEVAPAGGGSLLTASIVSAADGAVLAAFRETVDADGDVIAAIDGLSRQIREKAGESLPRIRAGEALTTVTTSSLDALRLYSEAMRLTERGQPEEALGLLEEAVQLDTAFAMAWRKISVLRSNASAPHLETSAAAARAYAHRDRLTERERYLAAAFYYDVAVGDLEAANRAYRSVLRLDPDDGTALNNLALNLLDMGRVDEATELLERAVDGPGESNVAHVNMMRAYLQSGDPGSARRALERAEERYPGSRWTNAWFAFLVADQAGEDEEAREAARRVAEIEDIPVVWRASGALAEGFLHLGAGRLGPALDRLDAATALAEREGRADLGLQMRAGWAARIGGFLDDPGLAAEILGRGEATRTFESLPPEDRPWGELVGALAAADRTREAAAVLDRWAEELPEAARAPGYEWARREAEARLHGARGSWETALESYRAARSLRGCRVCYRMELAGALARLERRAEAVEELAGAVEAPADGALPFFRFDRAVALARLGELHEALGDSVRAAEAYRAFAEAWADADPRLRPRVRRAGERADALAPPPSGP